MKALAALAALFCAFACHAAPDDAREAQARAAFEQVGGGRHLGASTFGDLDGDGIDDFATLLAIPHDNEDGVEDLQVLVFKGRPDGGFELAARSGAIFGHERVSHMLQVRHGSLYLHRDGSDGCCGRWFEDFQFKRRDGQLMLIGSSTARSTRKGSPSRTKAAASTSSRGSPSTGSAATGTASASAAPCPA